jgi:hypothetical protein
MNKGATYSLLAMMVLLVASLGLGVYAKLSNGILGVSADATLRGLPQYQSACRMQLTPLKAGLNRFENGGNSFSLEDQAILVDGELISFTQAQKRDIIGAVKNVTENRNLKEGVLGVSAGENFSLEVLDNSLSPQLCLKEIK